MKTEKSLKTFREELLRLLYVAAIRREICVEISDCVSPCVEVARCRRPVLKSEKLLFVAHTRERVIALPPKPRGVGAARLRRRMKNELNFPPNFEGLVLGCIDADFCK